MMTADLTAGPRNRVRGGRPTKAAAEARDERLLEIATRMFLDQGFEATSIDALAEAASIGKATLYARYADKAALFADVLRRRILQVYGPIEAEFGAATLDGGTQTDRDLPAVLNRVADRLLEKGLSDSSVTLARILAAQGPRFPDLAKLALSEGYGRQRRLIETILQRYADDPRYALDDIPLAADLFLSLVVGHTSRVKIYGQTVEPKALRHRTKVAVRIFVKGIGA